MKKTVMYTETRRWFFELNLAQGADLDETMHALKDTNGFYSYVDDCTSDEYESAWHEVPQDWRVEGDPDYTEDFRAIAKRELNGEAQEVVLSSLVDREQ
ncbi:hypothetical protein [Collinsella aerofaciens]|uniref:hypothetical protein n=1 Tax=Collinsella aerofaciens TaxID=74426 RepID=UPI003D797D97